MAARIADAEARVGAFGRIGRIGVAEVNAVTGQGATRHRPAELPPAAASVSIAGWVWAGMAGLLLWSLTYIWRQPGIDGSTPLSPLGNFALEGMILALAWLAALLAWVLAWGVALLTGGVVVRPTSRQ